MQGGDDDGEDGGSSGSASASDAPKFLVFAHHKTVMNRLAAALEGATGYAPVGYVRIDGGTDSEDRCVDASLQPWGTMLRQRLGIMGWWAMNHCSCSLRFPCTVNSTLCGPLPAAGVLLSAALPRTLPCAWRCCR